MTIHKNEPKVRRAMSVSTKFAVSFLAVTFSLLFSSGWWQGLLAMHFTLNSEYVAMVVARDLAMSDVESPNIKGVLLMQTQWKL